MSTGIAKDAIPSVVPFKRPFPLEVLTMIIKEINYSELQTCLRVSKHFFKVAGKTLYAELVIDEETDGSDLLMGAEEKEPRNFKAQLLKHVQAITIRSHHCPTKRTERSALTKAAKHMTGLQRVILCPDSDFFATFPLCENEAGCPIVGGLKPKSLTIGGISVDGTDDGPLELFTNIIKKTKHATLIVPPTAFYMGTPGFPPHLRGRPEDLAYPTRHLKTVRLIIAITEMEIFMQSTDRPTTLSSLEALQEFLAEFLNLNESKIEIYIFNDFDKTLDLVSFRQQLKVKVEKHYNDSIAYLTESGKLEPKHTNWIASYQVLGLGHYFARPKLHYELDDMWMSEWAFEVRDRQRARIEELKKAAAEREDHMSDEGESGSGASSGQAEQAKDILSNVAQGDHDIAGKAEPGDEEINVKLEQGPKAIDVKVE